MKIGISGVNIAVSSCDVHLCTSQSKQLVALDMVDFDRFIEDRWY
jgi:hypothetical protein